MNIKLLTDSSSDLPLALVQSYSDYLDFIGMPITIGDDEFVDDLGDRFSHDFFYEKLAQGAMPKTSQINVMSFHDKFVENHRAGYATVYIGLSSGLSGTYNNAEIAKNMILEEEPEASIVIVDSVAASIGLGALVLRGVNLIKDGKSEEEIGHLLNEERLHANHWFAVDNLMHLKDGGRIPAAAAYVGTVLSVKPILTMAYDGKLESYSSVRGKKKAYKFLANKVFEQIDDPSVPIIVGHANNREDAITMIGELRSKGVSNEIIETCLSATIASHVGPGMLGIAFMGTKDREQK